MDEPPPPGAEDPPPPGTEDPAGDGRFFTLNPELDTLEP